MAARIKWHGAAVEREVRKRMVRKLNVIGAMGERYTKLRITEADRIETNTMRSEMTFQVHPDELRVRYGNNVHYTVYQEMGTERGIKPMYALRGALDDIRQELR